ncbi:BTAD domain-containing putative transcriptional regulator [Streptomyces tsukubensis]|uniref:AfsR/SARP family transcriptional regulator n=1 Tax=Streptomyces tsukubensis TaxID=83656 RepID=UPI00368EFE4B
MQRAGDIDPGLLDQSRGWPATTDAPPTRPGERAVAGGRAGAEGKPRPVMRGPYDPKTSYGPRAPYGPPLPHPPSVPHTLPTTPHGPSVSHQPPVPHGPSAPYPSAVPAPPGTAPALHDPAGARHRPPAPLTAYERHTAHGSPARPGPADTAEEPTEEPAYDPADEPEAGPVHSVGILGPVVLFGPDGPTAPSGSVVRALLGSLALAHPLPVNADTFATRLWPDRTAPQARQCLHTGAHRLRSWLLNATDGGLGVVTQPSGYALTGGDMPTDLARFRHATERARQLADPQRRLRHLQHAHSLWRGRLLEGIPPECVDHQAQQSLMLEHTGHLQDLARAALDARRPREAIVAARRACEEDHFNESSHALLMEALTAAGMRVAALDVYEHMRNRLNRSLGIAPGEILKQARGRVIGR